MSTITNAQRLTLEIGVTIPTNDLLIYLAEEGLTDTVNYDPSSNVNKRQIYSTALAILNSIANNPSNMKNYKEDDISISAFADSIQNRIDQLERKIRMMSVTDDTNSSNTTFMLFSS
jgi:hypothetical protein